jgi:hypothetical protein
MPRPPSASAWLVSSLVIGGVAFGIGVMATDYAWGWCAGGGFAIGAVVSGVLLRIGHANAVRSFEQGHRSAEFDKFLKEENERNPE